MTYKPPHKRSNSVSPLSAGQHDANIDTFDHRTFVTPEDFGAAPVYGATADDTGFVQAALGSGRPVFLRRFYRVTNIYLPRLRGGMILQGNGALSGLIGSDSQSPAVLQTWDPNDAISRQNREFFQYYPIIRDFVIGGTAQCAMAVGGTVGGTIENIKLGNDILGAFAGQKTLFSGVDGFRFEETFGHSIRNVWTNGANISNIPFRICAAVLATTFENIYTSNICDYHIKISGERLLNTPFLNGAVPGKLAFISPTIQGAQKYGIWVDGYGDISFYNVYTEGNYGEVLCTRGGPVNFYSTSFVHHNANRTHSIWLEKVGDGGLQEVNFNQCRFTAHPIVIGDAQGPFHFTDCSVLGGGDLFQYIRKVPLAYSNNGQQTRGSMPVTVTAAQASNSNNATQHIMKTNGGAWTFARLQMDVSGNPVGSTPEIPPNVTFGKY